LTGKWGTTAWTVNTESVAHSEGDGTAAPLTGDRSPDVGSAGDRSRGDTVVSIPCTASATPTPYSSTGSPKGDTPTELSVSQSVSLPTTDVVVAAEDQNQDKTSTGSRSITEEQNQPQKPDQDFIVFDRERMATSPSELDPEERAVFDTLGSQDFVALLGIPYLFGGCEPNLCAIASVLKARNRSERWLVMLLQWVKKAEGREAKFWSSRIHTGTRGLTQLAKHLVTGELPQQFDAHLSLKDPEALQGKPYSNPLLFHDLVAEQYEPTSGGYKLKTEIREHEAKVKDWNEKCSTDYTLDELRPKAKAATVGFDEEEA
jgi:hypothetical protein